MLRRKNANMNMNKHQLSFEHATCKIKAWLKICSCGDLLWRLSNMQLSGPAVCWHQACGIWQTSDQRHGAVLSSLRCVVLAAANACYFLAINRAAICWQPGCATAATKTYLHLFLHGGSVALPPHRCFS